MPPGHQEVDPDTIAKITQNFSTKAQIVRPIFEPVRISNGRQRSFEFLSDVLAPLNAPWHQVFSHEIKSMAEEYLDAIRKHVNRLSMVDIEHDHQSLSSFAAELDGMSLRLGQCLFPEKLLEDLERMGVKHVVLIPEPALPPLPYIAMRTKKGIILDEPWTLSVAPSLLDISTFFQRAKVSRKAKLVWMAPDDDVNTNRGGFAERALISAHMKLDGYVGDQATLAVARMHLEQGRWLHLRSHGEKTHDSSFAGVHLHDGILTDMSFPSYAPCSPGFVVTAACHTAVTEGVGLELIGSVLHYDSLGLLGAVLTAWSVDGCATAFFMGEFYRFLSEGYSVALALKTSIPGQSDQIYSSIFLGTILLVWILAQRVSY